MKLRYNLLNARNYTNWKKRSNSSKSLPLVEIRTVRISYLIANECGVKNWSTVSEVLNIYFRQWLPDPTVNLKTLPMFHYWKWKWREKLWATWRANRNWRRGGRLERVKVNEQHTSTEVNLIANYEEIYSW